ncbi:hypothetical protein Phum_PHUM506470 [Pediculus humanus corporis]|uniref:Uncharacterized protein n=1 Tax=Pediculus humanus subsp. corporis TaxID=121224 RepID=E0VXX7_PEDHC|nr:uncharacterized protein Phum_PHUM506470 [Pediculus humanus corporis]EEB18233.1 hypothetical protein Phum_PHUM506470 [Pediculus humanus corporis]
MNFNQILSVALFAIVIQESFKSAVSIETITKYSKVFDDYYNDSNSSNDSTNNDKTNTEKTTTERNFNYTILPLNDTTEEYEYDDFDDLQEEQSPPSPMVDILKYFGGLVSLVSLINDFNGGGLVGEEQSKHEKHVRDVQESNPEEKKEDKVQATGKQFYESQDRFDFPQKKFKKPSSTKINTGNQQQYQTLENYPPYNPLTANAAETYNGDDKKTSYDVYNTGQQYESLNNDGGNSWDEVHPVYQPWMSKPQENNDDGLPSSNSYQWQQDDLKLGSDGTPETLVHSASLQRLFHNIHRSSRIEIRCKT